MIERLTLRNFQIHKKFDLELDPHVTVIVGPSDKGKSSILRALRWLATNRPSGGSFIAHGKESAWVCLSVDNHDIKRSKGGPGKNLYQLEDQLYEAFGQDVPAPVSDLLNLDPNLNFQRQHDAPFWFSLTPGEVAKELNAVVNLSLIDRTLANAAAEARQVKATIGVGEERLAKAKGEAKRLDWVLEADADLRGVEEKYNKVKLLADERTALASIIEGVREATARADHLSQANVGGLAAVSAWEKALAAGERAENLRKILYQLDKLAEDSTETARQLAAAKAELARVETCPACGGKL